MMTFESINGLIIGNLRHYSAKEANILLQKDVVLVDLRDEFEIIYKGFEVPDAIWIPFKEFPNRWTELSLDKNYILADSCGLRSKQACLFLHSKGYVNIANLIGGMIDWERDGLPTFIDRNFELTGSCVCKLQRRVRQ